MPGNPSEDEFTAEEIANFTGVGDDERKSIERYQKWLGLKEKAGNKETLPPPSQSSESPSMTLAGMKAMLADPLTRSTLQFLLGQEEASPANPAKPKPAPAAKKSGNILKFDQ
jgi:hypothetical protein